MRERGGVTGGGWEGVRGAGEDREKSTKGRGAGGARKERHVKEGRSQRESQRRIQVEGKDGEARADRNGGRMAFVRRARTRKGMRGRGGQQGLPEERASDLVW